MINFPSSPTVGQTYVFGNIVWTWNGTTWEFASPGTYRFLANDFVGGNGTSTTVIYQNNTIISNTTGINFINGNNIVVTVTDYPSGNRVNVRIDSTASSDGAAFAQANLALNVAQSAFAVANTGGGSTIIFNQTNVAINIAQSAFNKANAPVFIGDGPPSNPVPNSLWWQSNTGTLKVYYADSNSSQWVDASPGAGEVTLTNSHIFVGSVANVATDVAMSGDVTINTTGYTTIGAGKVTATMLANSYVVKIGDTMTGNLVVPALHIGGNGTVSNIEVGAAIDTIGSAHAFEPLVGSFKAKPVLIYGGQTAWLFYTEQTANTSNNTFSSTFYYTKTSEGTVLSATAINANIEAYANGRITDARVVLAACQLRNAANITNVTDFYATSPNFVGSVSGNVTNYYAFFAQANSGINPANNVTNRWGIYIDDPLANNMVANDFVVRGNTFTQSISGLLDNTVGDVNSLRHGLVPKAPGSNAYVLVGDGTWSTSGGGASVSIGDSPPANASPNSLWWQSNTATLKIYYADSNSTQWVDASPGTTSITLSNGHIFVGSGSNIATDVAVTGDVTISNVGVTSIGNSKVTPAMLSNPSGTGSEVLIQEVVTSSQNSVTFSSIATTWRDLKIRVHGRSTFAALNDSLFVQFNGDTGSNYHYGWAGGSTAYAGNNTVSQAQAAALAINGNTSPANEASTSIFKIPDYKGTTFKKDYVGLATEFLGDTSGNLYGVVTFGIWANTVAISSVKIFLASGSNFVNGSIISLYGIY